MKRKGAEVCLEGEFEGRRGNRPYDMHEKLERSKQLVGSGVR